MEIIINKEHFTFHVEKNLTEPCPECGVPACGKEDFFWYEKEGKRMALVLDGSYLDLVIQDYFKTSYEKNTYASLPKFLRESNECIGWSEADDFGETELEIDDLLTAITLIQAAGIEDWLKSEMIAYTQELKIVCYQAKSLGSKLYVTRS